MNFLEALEENKTRRVRILIDGKHDSYYEWFRVDQLRCNFKDICLEEITGKWEAEPEKIIIETGWGCVRCHDDSFVTFPTTILDYKETLIGKPTYVKDRETVKSRPDAEFGLKTRVRYE